MLLFYNNRNIKEIQYKKYCEKSKNSSEIFRIQYTLPTFSLKKFFMGIKLSCEACISEKISSRR